MVGEDGQEHLGLRLLILLELRIVAAARSFPGSVPSVGVQVCCMKREICVCRRLYMVQ